MTPEPSNSTVSVPRGRFAVRAFGTSIFSVEHSAHNVNGLKPLRNKTLWKNQPSERIQ